jgi:hypothetical protein
MGKLAAKLLPVKKTAVDKTKTDNNCLDDNCFMIFSSKVMVNESYACKFNKSLL